MAKKLYIEEVEAGETSAVYQETAPSEGTWLDKTNDLVSWDKYGEKALDYWFVLTHIKALAIPLLHPNFPTLDFSGWANLTADQKKAIAKTPYVPPNLRQEIFSSDEDWRNGEWLLVKTFGIDVNTLKGRRRVAEKMRQWVFLNYVWQYLMDIETSKQFGKDTRQMIDHFEAFADYDFYNWLTNAVGTPFENDGFMQKTYLPTQPEMETLRDELLIIYNGD